LKNSNMSGIPTFFIFGVARSGTNLVARMLDANPHSTVALDPLLPLFRAWRNQVVDQSRPLLKHPWNPQSSLQDYYFAEDGAVLLRAVLEADPTLSLTAGTLANLLPSVMDRAALESPVLAEAFSKWSGGTWKELLDSAMTLIANTAIKSGKQIKAAGVKEVWTIEFVRALAKALPDARFIVLHRDPRGVMASQMAMAKKDPTQAAHSISYMRHWRKHVTLARMFNADDALKDRILQVRYEDILKAPAYWAEKLAAFVGLEFEPAMLHPGKEQGWESNSSFTSARSEVDAQAAERWREKLPAHVIAVVEFHCGIEMRSLGYELIRPNPGELDAAVLRGIEESHASPGKWRSDSGDQDNDLAWECLRWQIAACETASIPQTLSERCFLAPVPHADHQNSKNQ